MNVCSTKKNVFPLFDLLSILTGLNLSATRGDGVEELMTYILGNEIKNQLEKNADILSKIYIQTPGMEICKSLLSKQFPELAKIKINPVQFYGEFKTDSQKFKTWKNSLENQYGSMLEVKTITEFNAEYKNKPGFSFSLFQNPSTLSHRDQLSKFIELLCIYVTDPDHFELHLKTGLSRGPAVALGQIAISELKKNDLKKTMEIAFQIPFFDAKQAAVALSELAYEMTPIDLEKAESLSNMAVKVYPKAGEIEMVRWIAKHIDERVIEEKNSQSQMRI